MSVNMAIIMGNLGKDPEIRFMPTNGMKTASFPLATSTRWTDKSTGEMKEKTEWHRVVVFDRLADVAEKYLKKGSQVHITGSIAYRNFKDQQTGAERFITEIRATDLQMVGGKPNSGSGAPTDPGANPTAHPADATSPSSPSQVSGDSSDSDVHPADAKTSAKKRKAGGKGEPVNPADAVPPVNPSGVDGDIPL